MFDGQALPDQSFLPLCYRYRDAGLSMLYKVNANSIHCLFSKLPSVSTYLSCGRRSSIGV